MFKGKFLPWVHAVGGDYSVLFAVLVLFAMTLLLTYTERLVYRKASLALCKNNRIWWCAFLQAAHPPFVVLLFVLFFFSSVAILAPYLEGSWILDIIPTCRTIVFFALFVWWIARQLSESEQILTRPRNGKPSWDMTNLKGAVHLLRTLAVVAVGLIFLQMLQIPISGVLAFGGLGGILVGFAGKDLLSNFFGGLMIFLDRPFFIGDWIRSPDKEIEGNVEYIGWRLTRIRTADKKPLFVPNALFLTISVENFSRMSHRRVKVSAGLSMQDWTKLPKILKEIEEKARGHEEIDEGLPILANLVGLTTLGVSALSIELSCYTREVDFVKFQFLQQDLALQIVETVYKHGGSFVFPLCHHA